MKYLPLLAPILLAGYGLIGLLFGLAVCAFRSPTDWKPGAAPRWFIILVSVFGWFPLILLTIRQYRQESKNEQARKASPPPPAPQP